MYFPTVARKLQALPQKKDMRKAFGLLVTDIIRDIEEKFGRMKPKTVKYQEFYFQDRKNELHKTSYEGPHFRLVFVLFKLCLCILLLVGDNNYFVLVGLSCLVMI